MPYGISRWARFAGALAMLSIASTARATITSNFDTGTESWTVYGDGNGPSFVATGGVEGGYLSSTDLGSGGIWGFQAPNRFLGDRSRAYGRTLTFSLKQSATDSPTTATDPLVTLTGGGITVVYPVPFRPGVTWTAYTVPLSETGWKKTNVTGAAVTEAEMRAVLLNLNTLRIRGEYRNGADTGGMDSVTMEETPAPPLTLPIVSTFDAGTEGWSVVGDVQGGSSTPSYIATGGNPGGFLRATDDATGGFWYWVASSRYRGDLSAAYGTALTYDLTQSDTSSQVDAVDVVLEGAGRTLVYFTGKRPGLTWTPYLVPLSAGAGWKIGTATGAPATEAEFREVLADVTDLRIRGEYRDGADTGSLDNVVLGAAVMAYGDANGDGAVNAADVLALLRIAGGLATMANLTLADIAPKPSADPRGFGDGRIDLRDALRLQRRLLGLEPTWP